MDNVQTRGNLFPPELVNETIDLVKGHSTIAKLAQKTPVGFDGNELFTFSMDNDIDIVAEGGAKGVGGSTYDKIRMVPLKVEYSARFSDEFLYSAKARLNYTKDFIGGYAKKLAIGLDRMVMHGVNPRGGAASSIIGTNHLDGLVTQTVDFDAAKIDENIEDAIALIQGSDGVVTGLALSPVVGQALSKVKVNGVVQYPEFRMGAKPDSFYGMEADINKTVTAEGNTLAYIGDFANYLRWGYAAQMPLKVIEFGDPDGSGRDLQRYNEIMLRSETYLGWGIMVPASFARIVEAEAGG